MSCPTCGSRELVLLPSGDFLCKSCGHKWPLPRVDYSWAEVEIKKAKLLERVEANDCRELVAQLSREMDVESAKKLATKILMLRKGKLTQSEYKCL